MIRALLRLCLGAAVWSGASLAAADATGIVSTYAEHTRGVELARAGRYDEGLARLYPLLERFPNDYPLTRDVVLINAWKGDCATALEYFSRIRARPRLDAYLVEPVAECAVRRARDGALKVAVETLVALLPHAADAYPLRRDLALITEWRGDCEGALRHFEPIRDDPRNPPYLVAPMAGCLLHQDRRLEAMALIEVARARHPDDPLLRHAAAMAEVALRLDSGLRDERASLDAELVSAHSDRDVRERRLRLEASARLTERWRLYGRYLRSDADDAALDAGAMHRVGVGLRWRPRAALLIDQAFSGDVDQSDRGGAHTRVTYWPYDTSRVSLAYDSYAEDISVRTRAAGIEARRSLAEVEYNSLDHVWYAYASASGYRFTDANRRGQFFATAGYAYAMLPEREHRLYLEWYGSRNTLTNAVYFNPARDRSISVVHATEFIFDTRYKRHVDRLYLSLGTYGQEGFRRNTIWGVGYEQDYDFDGANALVVGAAFSRNFYDGQREDEWRVSALYRRRF